MYIKLRFYNGVISMSRFSGKYDLCDALFKYTDDELAENISIYIGRDAKRLSVSSRKDIVPYYPYLIICSSYDSRTKSQIIHLASESFVDREERESLKFYLSKFLTIYNYCKRKHEKFHVYAAVADICFFKNNIEVLTELANRVRVAGKKADVSGLRLNMYEFYRRELVAEMLKYGIDPAEYGYARFVEEDAE